VIDRTSGILKEHDTSGLDIRILSPVGRDPCHARARAAGLDTISVTGNVLRDYLTDLFPILELGTSAKMLSIVPLLDGGGLYETGAGGSAPKHVRAVPAGELPALGFARRVPRAGRARSRTSGRKTATGRGAGRALDKANGRILENDKSPQRKVGEIDNRGSHFYLALYWARRWPSRPPTAELKASSSRLRRGWRRTRPSSFRS
jgi:isocitrate dehydrogenase